MRVPHLRRRLLRWYDASRRDLPWRATRDPYAIWVSEAMLQQTRVDVVVPYYGRWMAAFPTVEALAEADEGDVLACWSGLGYYARARNLQTAARQIVHRFGGRLPTDVEDLRSLPGVGPYTAAAVASIAFGQPVAVVDGNVERVVSRLAGLRGNPKAARNARRIRELAQAWLAPRRAGDWNQAVMDLGATVCTPRNPRCGSCPVASLCEAKLAGTQAVIPAPRTKAAPRVEQRHFAVVRRRDQLLFVRAPTKGLLGGMWLLPGAADRAAVADEVERQTGVRVRMSTARARRARHQFSHRTWDMHVHAARPQTEALSVTAQAAWLPIGRLGELALPTAMRVALQAAGVPASPPASPEAKTKTRRASAGPG